MAREDRHVAREVRWWWEKVLPDWRSEVGGRQALCYKL